MGVVIRKMRVEDLVDAKGIDLLCWNDLMEKSYGIKGKLSARTDESILSFLHSDPEGSFVASDEFAGVIGSCFSHVWGTTGWVGPLSVLPSYQARGLGKDLLRSSLRYLEDQRCVDIGLETMPESSTNLGMYLKVGLRPEGMVFVLGKKIEPHELQDETFEEVSVERYSESQAQEKLRTRFKNISNTLRMGLDYTKEVDLTMNYSLGDTLVATLKEKVVGFAVVHTVQKRLNVSATSVRVLAVAPGAKLDVFETLIGSSELMAADAGTKEISIAVPASCRRALDSVFSRGYSIVQSFERLMWMGSSGMSDANFNLCTWSG